MFDICSYYCENFIYISLSIAIWHGIIENWRITKMPFQHKRSIPLNITQTNRGVEFSIFSREKHISWRIFGLNHRLNNKKVEKSSSCLKSKEQSRKSKTTHKRVELTNYVLQRQSHPFEQMERSALSLKKSILSFGAVKNPNLLFSLSLFLFLE